MTNELMPVYGQAPTMTSLELVDFINEDRKARAEAESGCHVATSETAITSLPSRTAAAPPGQPRPSS